MVLRWTIEGNFPSPQSASSARPDGGSQLPASIWSNSGEGPRQVPPSIRPISIAIGVTPTVCLPSAKYGTASTLPGLGAVN